MSGFKFEVIISTDHFSSNKKAKKKTLKRGEQRDAGPNLYNETKWLGIRLLMSYPKFRAWRFSLVIPKKYSQIILTVFFNFYPQSAEKQHIIFCLSRSFYMIIAHFFSFGAPEMQRLPIRRWEAQNTPISLIRLFRDRH